jgi:hypothetical protein
MNFSHVLAVAARKSLLSRAYLLGGRVSTRRARRVTGGSGFGVEKGFQAAFL